MEDDFFLRKLELDYGDNRAKEKIIALSKKVKWLKGWPDSRGAFWNGESFMWGNKISSEKRELIKQELSFLEKSSGNQNLDIGCGSYSYVNSVGFDISERMLKLNDNLVERFVGDVEKKLPFPDGQFSSVTMVFLLNYVNDFEGLLQEVGRVLDEKGKLVVVQSKEKVNSWQRQHVVNNIGFIGWKRYLEGFGFKVDFYEKEGLGFFRCQKTI